MKSSPLRTPSTRSRLRNTPPPPGTGDSHRLSLREVLDSLPARGLDPIDRGYLNLARTLVNEEMSPHESSPGEEA